MKRSVARRTTVRLHLTPPDPDSIAVYVTAPGGRSISLPVIYWMNLSARGPVISSLVKGGRIEQHNALARRPVLRADDSVIAWFGAESQP